MLGILCVIQKAIDHVYIEPQLLAVVDQATTDQTRPSTARVKIEVDLLAELRERVRLLIKEPESNELKGHKIGNTTGENNASEDGDVQVVETLNNDNFVNPGHAKEVEEQPSGIKKNFTVDGVIKATLCDAIQVQIIANNCFPA
ncbi:hypothetical protein HAX54_031863 [Datura stramonium]|uniref:Uncharacterized protein n=1 Tax=Datura stramonium TaxID=4076 RepID=A0ABS8SCG7_DATST|nr:hypothetical protein [Datura stramonium]